MDGFLTEPVSLATLAAALNDYVSKDPIGSYPNSCSNVRRKNPSVIPAM